MKLDGFGVAGYRSFGKDLVYLPDLAKVNVIAGKNNSGKSNFLRFCKHLSQMQVGQEYSHFNKELDYCKDCDTKAIRFALQIKKDSPATGHVHDMVAKMLPRFSDKFPQWISSIWLEYSVVDRGGPFQIRPDVDGIGGLISSKYNDGETNELAKQHLTYSGGTHEKRARDLAQKIAGSVPLSFPVRQIGAFRQITHEGNGSILEGKGLIQELRKAQAPELSRYQTEKQKFATINELLRELLGEQDAFLEIPAAQDEIYVSIKSKILPLGSLGTGIHELIILASAVTLFQDTVFCIEEPEIHIHPELQKKFIRYIQEKTDNQYLISTHSSACFDVAGVNIYHCKLVGNNSSCELVATDRERGGILVDLGYKASDLLQANYIIWVEGPSDRIYLNSWIRGKDPTLEEGLHYSIMFYGGRLLSHLAFDSPEVEEFVRLCKLNQNAAIVIDSDKPSAHSHVNATKKRVIKNFKDNDCLVWVTAGREIENYIPGDTLNNCVKEVHPKMRRRIKWDRFDRLTRLDKNTSVDKVAVARKVASRSPDYSVLDLDKRVDALIDCIRRVNS